MGTSPCVNVFLALDTWLYHYNVLVCYRTYLDFKIESNYVVISPEALLLLSDKSFNLDQLSLAVQWENVFFPIVKTHNVYIIIKTTLYLKNFMM